MYEKTFKLAKQFRRKLGGFFSETPEEIAEREAQEEARRAEGQRLNQELLNKVESWLGQFDYDGAEGAGLDPNDKEMIMEIDRRFESSGIMSLSSNFQLDLGAWLNLSFTVDIKTGELEMKNVHAGFSGRDIPESMKTRIQSATGRPLNYHAPTKAWVYDAQIDGGLEPGDTLRMATIASKNLSQDTKGM